MSSEAISPAVLYKERKLGFNHFELSDPNPSEDHLFFYDRIISWNIQEGSDDNYPLVVEIDESVLARQKTTELNNEYPSILVANETVYLSPETTRFLFRTNTEKEMLLLKATVTLENKCEKSYRDKNCFDTIPNDVLPLDSAIRAKLKEWVSTQEPCELAASIKKDMAAEQDFGAALGFSIGQWRIIPFDPENCRKQAEKRLNIQKDVIDAWCSKLGISLDKILELISPDYTPLYLRSRNALPALANEDCEPYSLLKISMIFIRDKWNYDWRWDNVSVVNFCNTLWKDVLHAKLETSSDVEQYRDSLNRLLRNLQSITNAYSIKDERNSFIQALAAFVIGGRDEEKLARLLTSEKVKLPEITLALYGAVVGYARFPRTLMFVKTYEQKRDISTLIASFCALGKEKGRGKGKKEHLWVNMFHNEIEKKLETGMMSLEDFEKWCKENKAGTGAKRKEFINNLCKAGVFKDIPPNITKKEEQGMLDFNAKKENLFIEDLNCQNALRKGLGELKGFDRATMEKTAQSLNEFQVKYKINEYYGKHPEQYKRDNPNTIDHFLSCLFSDKTKELNVDLDKTQKEELKSWLEKRYECKARTKEVQNNH